MTDEKNPAYPKMLKRSEAAKLIGISRRKFSELIQTGVIKAYTAGGTYRVKESDVLQYLEDTKVKKPRN